MELGPRKTVTPFHWIHAWSGIFRIDLAKKADVVIRRHRPSYFREGLRALGMHVTPPIHRLNTVIDLEPPVITQNIPPQPRVHAPFYHVIHRRKWPLGRQFRIQICEQGAVVHELH